MRGKKIKQLRRVIREMFSRLPEVQYCDYRVYGEPPVILPITLGDCQRKKLKEIKIFYKESNR